MLARGLAPPRSPLRRCCGASAAKMPPVWNQRTPSSPNSLSQFTSPGLICEAAELPRSEQPSAARTPKPFSVKLRPTRVLRPIPSNSRQMMCEVSTPPWHDEVFDQPAEIVVRQRGDDASSACPSICAWRARHCIRRRLPTPGTERALRTRPKPGSKRSITSPNEAQSHLRLGGRADFQDFIGHGSLSPDGCWISAIVSRDLLLDAVIVLGVEQFLGDQVRADADAGDAAP